MKAILQFGFWGLSTGGYSAPSFIYVLISPPLFARRISLTILDVPYIGDTSKDPDTELIWNRLKHCLQNTNYTYDCSSFKTFLQPHILIESVLAFTQYAWLPAIPSFLFLVNDLRIFYLNEYGLMICHAVSQWCGFSKHVFEKGYLEHWRWWLPITRFSKQ